MLHQTTIHWSPERMRRLIFSLICSSSKPANVPKPISVGMSILPNQDRLDSEISFHHLGCLEVHDHLVARRSLEREVAGAVAHGAIILPGRSLRPLVYDRSGQHVRTREDAVTYQKIIAVAALTLAALSPAAAQTEVKIGLIAPMSGPWARQGDLMLKGANLAIADINK